jgi:hypothetical protein
VGHPRRCRHQRRSLTTRLLCGPSGGHSSQNPSEPVGTHRNPSSSQAKKFRTPKPSPQPPPPTETSQNPRSKPHEKLATPPGRIRVLYPFQRLRVLRHIVGQEFESDKATKVGVLGLIDHAHPTAAELLHDAVVRDGLADHWRESYVCEIGKSMKAVELAACGKTGLRTPTWLAGWMQEAIPRRHSNQVKSPISSRFHVDLPLLPGA